MLLLNKRIFYVEDNVQNRAIVQLILEREGAKVHFERWGGDDALTRLTAFLPVDLILLDLMFPKNVSGYDVFERIRAVPACAEIPIVAISAADPETEIPKARSMGFSGFICKPVSIISLAQQINDILAGKPVWTID